VCVCIHALLAVKRLHKATAVCKRDLHIRQKRPTHTAKETYTLYLSSAWRCQQQSALLAVKRLLKATALNASRPCAASEKSDMASYEVLKAFRV